MKTTTLERKDNLFRGNFGGPLMELKEVSETGEFEGYASVFSNMDRGRDIIAPGAFAESLTRMPANRIKMLWQHDSHCVIGKWTEAYEDNKGLYVKGKLLTDIPKAKEVHTLLKEQAIEGMSIGYRTNDYEWDEDERVRTITKCELWEVSVVTFPMNTLAGVTSVKDAGGIYAPPKIFEQVLRDAGLSRTEAKEFMTSGYSGLKSLRDAGEGAGDAELTKALQDAAAKIRAA